MSSSKDTKLEARRKEAEFAAKVWKMNLERNLRVPPNETEKE